MSPLPFRSPIQVMESHPCFGAEAHRRVGRVHLPVAPRCNIQCAFCERRICANLTMQHPGWARELLSPAEAAESIGRLVMAHPAEPFVVGVAGPGEPLANDETFETLEIVHREHPTLVKCLSTNGLLLEERMAEILAVGISAITITINAPDSAVGEKIYAWVKLDGEIIRGRNAVDRLLESQFCGVESAIRAELAVKVNTVLIPGVNDRHVVDLAHRLKVLGVPLMNLMPLIPGGRMRDQRPPTCEELQQARSACEEVLPQFRLCEQCRADVVRFPGRPSPAGPAPNTGRGGRATPRRSASPKAGRAAPAGS